jgi:hypothetical protein
MTLFERYSNLLQRKFSAEFDQVSLPDSDLWLERQAYLDLSGRL